MGRSPSKEMKGSERGRRVARQLVWSLCSQSPHDEAVVARCAQWRPHQPPRWIRVKSREIARPMRAVKASLATPLREVVQRPARRTCSTRAFEDQPGRPLNRKAASLVGSFKFRWTRAMETPPAASLNAGEGQGKALDGRIGREQHGCREFSSRRGV